MEKIFWQVSKVSKLQRAEKMHQTPCCLWLTGLSGAGKSTIAQHCEARLHEEGRYVYLLDGDNVRHGLNSDLKFDRESSRENIRRIAEVAKLMVDAGLIVLVAFISPFREERQMARSLFAEGEFVEVFVDTPLAVCEQRDTKGLYAKARRGEIRDFTGIGSPYEVPVDPELHVFSDTQSLDEIVQEIISAIRPPNLAKPSE